MSPRPTASRGSATSALVARVNTVIPHLDGHLLLLPGLRVLLALYAPLLLGMAIARPHNLVPVAVGALMGALVDPGCSTQRRALTITATALLGSIAFAVGDLAGQVPALAVAFVTLVAFASGFAPEFGAAGIRGSLYVVTSALLGVASTGVNPGFITAPGLLLGGAWALLLAVGPFRQQGAPVCGPVLRARRLTDNLREHLMLRTAIGRHAARTAVVVGFAMSLSFALQRPAISWIAGAAIAVLHPRASAHGVRGVRLVTGTLVGGIAAVLLADALGPTSVLLLALAPALFLSVSLRAVDYVAYTIASTAFMLALSAFTMRMGWGLFDARIVDTALGVTLALTVARFTMPLGERDRLAAEILAR